MARSTTRKTSSKTTGKTGVKTATKASEVGRAPAKAASSSLPKTRKPAADAVVVEEVAPTPSGPELKKSELIDAVVAQADIKKRDAKPAIEAALQIIGEALAEGREINLQPLGKIRVNRMKQLSSARVLNCKIRQTIKNEDEGKDPLAEAAE